MTSKQIAQASIRFKNPPRFPMELPAERGYISDFYYCWMSPSLDTRLSQGTDEWGSVWSNPGKSSLGEVVHFPIKEWSDFDEKIVPKIHSVERFSMLKNRPPETKDKYIIANGVSIYERVHFLRGLENTWEDIYHERENLCGLLDILVDMNLELIKLYAENGVNGYIFADDWGLQNTLMISPQSWREIWKPRYKKIYDACHAHDMDAHLHSCGYITDIIDDLIEIGCDVIHMDQQENMGLDNLGERFGGKINFRSSVDIQTVMANNDLDAIRSYCGDLVRNFFKNGGGFIAGWYTDPVGAGHTDESIKAMCDEFIRLNGM